MLSCNRGHCFVGLAEVDVCDVNRGLPCVAGPFGFESMDSSHCSGHPLKSEVSVEMGFPVSPSVL